MLSIMYFKYNKARKELNIVVRVRWWNLIVTLVATAIALFYMLHLLADSILGGK